MNGSKLVILFMHILSGLCDTTLPKNDCPPLLSILKYTNICSFLVFYSILIWFAVDSMGFIQVCITESIVFYVFAPLIAVQEILLSIVYMTNHVTQKQLLSTDEKKKNIQCILQFVVETAIITVATVFVISGH